MMAATMKRRTVSGAVFAAVAAIWLFTAPQYWLFTATTGLTLAISGNLGGQGTTGAFIAAALAGKFTILDSANNPINSLTAFVAIVSDGPGPRGP